MLGTGTDWTGSSESSGKPIFAEPQRTRRTKNSFLRGLCVSVRNLRCGRSGDLPKLTNGPAVIGFQPEKRRKGETPGGNLPRPM